MNTIMSASAEHDFVERWTEAHRLGLALQILDVFRPGQPEHENAWAWLSARFGSLSPESLTRSVLDWPEYVVRQAIRVLGNAAIVGPTLGDVGARLRMSYERALAQNYYRNGRIIAHAAMYSEVDGPSLLRIGLLFTKRATWKSAYKSNSGQRLTVALDSLRRTPTSIRERISALSDFKVLNVRERPVVTNTLLSHLFGWPLLVLEGHRPIGISVPIAIDLEFTRSADTQIRGRGDFFDAENWDLPTCRWRALRFWADKHGSSRTLKSQLRNARVVLEVSYAERILSILNELKVPTAEIEGASALPYITEMVLARCLGTAFMLPTAVTATLGKSGRPRPGDDRPNPNCELVLPGHVSEKKSFVASSGLYSGIAVPSRDGPLGSDAVAVSDEFADSLEVNIVPWLETLNDVVQQHWRPYAYVGCPDVCWGIHGRSKRPGVQASPDRPGLLDQTDPSVARVLEQLTGQSNNVVHLSEPVLAVASALWHIQTDLRPRLPEGPPAALSWAFVRIEEYPPTVILQTLWRIAGGKRRSLHELLATQSCGDADRLTLDILNAFTPTRYRPYRRAPDILVLIRQGAWQLDSTSVTPPDVLDLGSLFSRLNGRMAPVPELGLQELLGQTRVLFVHEPSADVLDARAGAPPSNPAIAHALSLYRRGFRLSTAKECLARLGFSSHQSVLALRELMEADLVRHCAGEYHIREDVREWTQGQEIGTFHLEARLATGFSLAPYLSEEPRMASLARSFHPYAVAEAYYQFKVAHDEARRVGAASVWQHASRSADLIARAFMPESWASLRCLLTVNGMPALSHGMAKDLLGRVEREGAPTPLQLLAAARAAYGHAHPKLPETRQSTLAEAFNLYARAWALTGSRDVSTRIQIGTWFHYHVLKSGGDPVSDLPFNPEELVDLLSSDPPPTGIRVCPSWAWEFLDSKKGHDAALSTYVRLIKNPVTAKDDFVISGLGTARLARRQDLEDLLFSCYQRENDRTRWIHSYWRYCAWKRQRRGSPVMMYRWKRGLEALADHFGLALPADPGAG